MQHRLQFINLIGIISIIPPLAFPVDQYLQTQNTKHEMQT
jgi:hypothetical protein